jgi:hypothetical protein
MKGFILFKEMWLYFNTKTSKEARAFGHLYESISLIEREKRCQKHWQSHRLNCKNFILKTLAATKKNNAVLVLGSGPLHEIPLIELAKHFKKVDLVDVVHLNETKKKYTQLKNIFFIEADITELEKIIYKKKSPYNKTPDLFLDKHYDLVISANLLSQLSYHLRSFLEKNSSVKLSEDELDTFCYQVSLDHFKYLKNFNSPVILITDLETHIVGKNNELLEIQTPYINFDLPKISENWVWDLAPLPEFSKNFSVKMQVAAFILNNIKPQIDSFGDISAEAQ